MKYIDLLISNDDLTPDAGGIPEKMEPGVRRAGLGAYDPRVPGC